MITINDKKIIQLLLDKDELVKQGRLVSDEIERVESKITACEVKERKITEKCQPKELGEEAEALKAQINELIAKFEKVAGEITKVKLEAIPKDLEATHKELMKKREEKERERNKIALKIQKIKDRVIPLIQKVVKPQLKEYEDIQTAQIKKGVVEVEVFSRLEEWKNAYQKAQEKK